MIEGLSDLLRGAVDDTFAEALRHLPMAGGVPDTARAPAAFSAPLRTGDRAAVGAGTGRRSERRVDAAADGGVLRIDRGAFPGLEIRRGDRVVALARDGAPVFEVLSVDDRSHLRLICRLGDI